MDFSRSSVSQASGSSSGVCASPEPMEGVVIVSAMCLCTFLGKMTPCWESCASVFTASSWRQGEWSRTELLETGWWEGSAALLPLKWFAQTLRSPQRVDSGSLLGLCKNCQIGRLAVDFRYLRCSSSELCSEVLSSRAVFGERAFLSQVSFQSSAL